MSDGILRHRSFFYGSFIHHHFFDQRNYNSKAKNLTKASNNLVFTSSRPYKITNYDDINSLLGIGARVRC
jgi:hypothetical protein